LNKQAIYNYIDQNIDKHTARVQEWVKQPSVSWDNLGVEDCAKLVARTYKDLGCSEVDLLEGRFHPGLWAYYDAGATKTIHNYCMFDTRPVANADKWNYDPWGGELVQYGDFPKVVVGRGALGAKGPYVAFLNALEAIIAVEGTLPVNIMFLAEGEEIMMSPAYKHFVEAYSHRLKEVSASYCVMGSQSADGSVPIWLGMKGMVVLELSAKGANWDKGPSTTIHSSAAGLVQNLPIRLSQALASLVDNGGRCVVDGLEQIWSYRKSIATDEEALLQGLAQRFKGKDWRNALPLGGTDNIAEIVGGMNGMDPLKNYLYGPTMNVSGLRSGFIGMGTHTNPAISPGVATATIDLRMVVEMPAQEIIGSIRKHLDSHGFTDIEIDVLADYDFNQAPCSFSSLDALKDTLHSWDVEPVVWPLNGGGGPWTAVANAFGVPCIRGGAIGGGGNGPGNIDEYLVIEGNGKVAGLAESEKYHVDALFNFAASL
tara:strand:+ start:1327 stop:2781 length:1455 start_codon:yes stop_codon:yes gene_type:complete